MSTSRVFFFCFVGLAASKKQCVWYHMKNDTYRRFCRFGGHSTQTDCGSSSGDPKMHHPAKRSLATCEHTGGDVCDFIVAIHRDICCEHRLIERRNCLMTEAASSLSAAAGQELSTTRKPIANLASD